MEKQSKKAISPFRTFINKLLKQRMVVISFYMVFLIVLIGLFGPLFAPYDPDRPVLEQYSEKGIKIDEASTIQVPILAKMSDGSMVAGNSLPELTVKSEERRIATARERNGQIQVSANGEGTTAVVLSNGDVSAVIQINVGKQKNEPILSRIEAGNFENVLELGDTKEIELSGFLSNGKELSKNDLFKMIQQKEDGEKKDKPDSSGFNAAPSSAKTDDAGSLFESVEPEIVSVSKDGLVTPLKEGEGAIRVSIGSVSTIIPVSVGGGFSVKQVVEILPEESQISLSNLSKHQPPSSRHWFGTDHQNRDIFSRILVGTADTLLIGFVSVAIGAVIGTFLGLLAGYYGRWIDVLITRFTDILLAFPGILLAIAVIALLGPGITNIIFAVAFFTVPTFVRIVRGSTLALKEKTYVEAAQSIGVQDSVIIFRHIFPGTVSVVLVYFTMRVGIAILIGASLSFLGLGGDITAPEWGAMLSSAKDNSINVFHPTFFPGIAIVLTALSFNILGDGLRDALDPKLKD
ncbi:ABC transporter permease subunit [Neobacillus sp. YIM B06451]|uniref:ABC transporter permease subunit n=1 Tax=Neobacillus sp. YIM B06451 TaxID=3070994 RepID=UPI002930E8E6|nr:ABC transporter permease subunit [Neobacillus sp. YIM B06451]